MFEFITDPQNILNIMTALIGLVFGASCRTIRSLKTQKTTVKVSLIEWLNNQATSVPLGLIALFVTPHYYPSIAPAEMVALMIAVGVFGNEVFIRSRGLVESGDASTIIHHKNKENKDVVEETVK